MKHTPGPWTIEPEPRSNCIKAVDNGGCSVLRVQVYGDSTENIEANTRLIAAAPDLLDLAEAIITAYGGIIMRDHIQDHLYQGALAAIAKAEEGK